MFAYLGDRLGLRTEKSVISSISERFAAADPLHLHKQAAIHAASQQAQDRSPHGGSGKQGAAQRWHSRSDTRSLLTLPWQAGRDDPMRNNETSTMALH